MSKNGSMKERTLDKLREESSTIYQGTRLIVFLKFQVMANSVG